MMPISDKQSATPVGIVPLRNRGSQLPMGHHAVAGVVAHVPEPDAAVIAAWLTDLESTPDGPPLPSDGIGEIVRQFHAQRHRTDKPMLLG